MLATDGGADILGVPWYWFVVGGIGQLMFGSRFLVQWIASERARKSIIPMAFWYLSICGGLLMLAYAVFYLGDPIVIFGQATGSIVYFRNIYLRRVEKQAAT